MKQKMGPLTSPRKRRKCDALFTSPGSYQTLTWEALLSSPGRGRSGCSLNVLTSIKSLAHRRSIIVCFSFGMLRLSCAVRKPLFSDLAADLLPPRVPAREALVVKVSELK